MQPNHISHIIIIAEPNGPARVIYDWVGEGEVGYLYMYMSHKFQLLILVVLTAIIAFSAHLITKDLSNIYNKVNSSDNINSMNIKSKIFKNNKNIPEVYSCYGSSKPINLEISNIPENAQSLALVVDDPDAPNGDFVHWVLYNIDPKETFISTESAPEGSITGLNSSGGQDFVAPCPPSGTHHYYFRLYAIDVVLPVYNPLSKSELLKIINGHIIDNTTLVGLYGKNK